MRRDEAIDLLQVMLLDERPPPPLAPRRFNVRVDQLQRQHPPRIATADTSGSRVQIEGTAPFRTRTTSTQLS